MKLSYLGLIGDVHAEAERLEAALLFLRQMGVEHILCVGDIVDGPGDVDRCCELLDQARVAVVRGNHDRWLVDNQMRDLPEATQREALSDRSKTFIESLPTTRTFETVAGRLLLCHGLGDNDMQSITPQDYGYALEVKDELHELIQQRQFRFIVNGHTHRRMVRHFEHLTVINAGTLYHAHEPCIALVDFKSNTADFLEITGNVIGKPNDTSRLFLI
ncbi:MAG: metallophosphoesterase [Proteobacteria bacterium]|nr:MAG: metallophosphoesterase [Pseudomonadota bacterium]